MSNFFVTESKTLKRFKKSERKWHLPLVVTICICFPILLGILLDRTDYGMIAGLSGFVILYMPNKSVVRRMITLMACSFGFILAYTVGVCFSFNPFISSIALGIFSAFTYRTSRYFILKAPGNFFFIMIASIASCLPFDIKEIPVRVGLMALGTIFACLVALFYSLYITKKSNIKSSTIEVVLDSSTPKTESFIVGFFMFLSLFIGKIFNMDNPYWLPISTAAVIQGATLYHVYSKSYHRIIGTIVGLGVAWILLSFNFNIYWTFLWIIILQYAVETFIVRNYALTMVFITPLTILLTDFNSYLRLSISELIFARFIDIVIGSCLGVLAGWVLHQYRLRGIKEI